MEAELANDGVQAYTFVSVRTLQEGAVCGASNVNTWLRSVVRHCSRPPTLVAISLVHL